MLIAKEIVITNPNLPSLSEKDIALVASRIRSGEATFVIPADIKEFCKMQKDGPAVAAMAESYKVGFLYTAFRRCFPSESSKETFDRIRWAYQVYASTRRLQLRLTNYRKIPQLSQSPAVVRSALARVSNPRGTV